MVTEIWGILAFAGPRIDYSEKRTCEQGSNFLARVSPEKGSAYASYHCQQINPVCGRSSEYPGVALQPTF